MTMQAQTSKSRSEFKFILPLFSLLAVSAFPHTGFSQQVTTDVATVHSALVRQPPQAVLAPERKVFQDAMVRRAVPGPGCFTAHYPQMTWNKSDCSDPPKHPFPHAQGPHPAVVGNGTDEAIEAGSAISFASGSFDSVLGATSEFGPNGDDISRFTSNAYSLQLNANTFSSSECDSANCFAWQQFILATTDCDGGPCIFIQYWLVNHSKSCPEHQGWTFYPGNPGDPGCYKNGPSHKVSSQPISQLATVRLSGSETNGMDVVTLLTGDGDVTTQASSTVLSLAGKWTGAEFNIFGDCCGSEAFLSIPSTLNVRITTDGTRTPICDRAFGGDTGEMNNLNLTGACSASASPQSIAFSETNSELADWLTNFAPLPKGEWEGVKWDKQTSRASNDHVVDLTTSPTGTVVFTITDTPENIADISFDVAVDRPGSDPTIWRGLKNNSIVDFNSLSQVGLSLEKANERGFYICQVHGATHTFHVNLQPN